MRHWSTVRTILKYSWKPLFQFELLYKLLAITVFAPLLSAMFQGIMYLTGYAYLTVENLSSFLSNPLTLVLIFLLLLCLAVYSVFDIGAVLYAIDLGYRQQRAGVQDMLAAAARASLRVLRPRNWLIVLVAVLLLPLLNLGIVANFVTTVAIPEAVLHALLVHWPVAVALALAIVLLCALLLRWMYAFHYFLLEGCSFHTALWRSARLGRGRHLGDFVSVFLLQAAFSALFLLLTLLLIAVIYLITALFASITLLNAVLTSVVWVTLGILLLIFAVLSAPLSFCCVSVLYYLHKGQAHEPILRRGRTPPRRPRRPRLFRAAEIAVFCISIACCSAYVYQVASGNANFHVEYLYTTEVTAHRGASALYPENTMSAFRGAVELGADWIELDVQQTRDGKIIVMHDTNLARTTGLRQDIWQTDYAQIATLDAGSWFSPAFAGERVPLLSEVLDFAKAHKVRLNIELKPTGHETDFERAVVDLVRRADYLDQCVITSQSYAVLERIKAYAPQAQTVYVMSVAYGNLLKLDAADAFSVKSINITSEMVSQLHNAGKEIYAWTVNTQNNLDKMIRLKVDNLVTDNIVRARERIYANKTSSIIQEYLALLSGF